MITRVQSRKRSWDGWGWEDAGTKVGGTEWVSEEEAISGTLPSQ